MLVHRMVKKVKDSKVWAKINMKDSEYELGSGHLGNGITIWNRKQQEHGDYKKIAHVGPDRKITWMISNPPSEVKTYVESIANGPNMGASTSQPDRKVFNDEASKLESLKRQLIQAKQTGGDKSYEKELEAKIATLENRQKNEGLTKDEYFVKSIMQSSKYDPIKWGVFPAGSNVAAFSSTDKEEAERKAKELNGKSSNTKDQIIKGFLIYKSGKGPAQFVAKNENGKQFEGSMEEIKKQIDDYWIKCDEDVMKQKVRDEELRPNQKIAVTKLINFKGNTAQYKNGNRIYEVKKDQTGAWHLTGEYEYTGDKKTKDATGRLIGKYEGYDIYKQDDGYYLIYLNGSAIMRVRNPEEAKNEIIAHKKDTQKRADMRPQDKRTKDVEGEIVISMSNMSKYMELKGKGYTVAWVGEGKIAFVPPKPKTKDSKSLSEYKQEHAQLLDALKAEKAKSNPDKAEIKKIKDNIAAAVGMISAMMTKDKSIHPRFRIKDDKLFRLRDCLGKLKGRDTYTKGSADKKTKDEETSYKGYHISKGQHETGLSGYKIDNPNGRRPLMDFYKTIGDAKEAIDKFGIYLGKDSKDKYTGDPLTAKGRKIMAAMREKYGAKKGKQVFFASRNKGTIKNVDLESMDSKTKDDLFETIRKIRNSSGAILGTIAIYDAVGEFVVETWNLKSGKDVKKVVKRFPYEGNEDRKAALAMARGFVNTYPDYEFKDSKTKDNEPNQSDIEAAQRGNNMVGMSLVDLDDLIRLMEGKSDFAARVTVAAAKQMIAAKKRMGAKDSTRKVIHHLIKTKQRKVI